MIDRLDLHAVADGQLAPERRAELEAQLAGDPAAQKELDSILAMKSMLKSNAETPECAELWRACRSRLDELDKARRVENFVGRYAWGICGSFLVLILVAGVFQRSRSGHVASNEVSSYVAGLAPISVPRNQNNVVLDQKLKAVIGQTFANRPGQMVISGVGENTVPGQRSQFVQLSDQFGRVAVVAMPDVRQVDGLTTFDINPRFGCSTVDGVNALFWKREDNVICMVVGNRTYDELYDIVQAMGR